MMTPPHQSPPRAWRRGSAACAPSRRRAAPAPLLLLAVALCSAALTILFSRAPPAARSLRALPEEPSHAPHKRRAACPRAAPVYVFVHLHKTAGNSLKKALFAFSKRNSLRLHHTCHAAEQDSAVLAWWFNRRKDPVRGMDCNLDVLAAMSRKRRNGIDVVMGHQYVGVHTLFPSRDVRYFTFMRQPLERKVSHFMHFEKHADPVALTRYLIERNRNYMVKRLATDATSGEITADLQGRFVDVDSFATRAALRAAKRNLANRFFFVGLQERYGESVCMLSRILNTACGRNGQKLASKSPMRPEKMYGIKENERGKTKEVIEGMSALLRAAALRAEAADVELYRYAEQLFEEKLKRYPECRREVHAE